MENIKHIFSVQSSVAKIIQWIEEDKLLQAHQCLADLENSRDDILYELHKLPKQYALDKVTLKNNFAKVEAVSGQMGQKIRLILDRCLATVRKEPTIIVTAMRIVKREETADAYALQVNIVYIYWIRKIRILLPKKYHLIEKVSSERKSKFIFSGNPLAKTTNWLHTTG